MRKIGLAASVIIMLLFGAVSFAQAEVDNDRGKYRLGVGSGLSYGGDLGVGLELTPQEHFSLSAAMGYLDEGKTGWTLGMRLYPVTFMDLIRPRLVLNYGVVALLSGGGLADETDLGFSYGIGLDLRGESNISFDFDLLRRDYTPPPGYVAENDSDVFISLGIGYNF